MCRFEQGALLLSAALDAWDKMEQDGHAAFLRSLERKMGMLLTAS